MSHHRSKLVLICVLSFIMVLTACSTPTADSGKDGASPKPTNSAPANTDQPNPDQPKIVKVYTPIAANEVAKEKRQKQIDAFEKLNPGYKVQWTEGETKVESGKLTTFLNSGLDLPHVFWTNSGIGRIKALASANLIMPLDDLYKEHKWEEKLNKDAYKFAELNRYEGHLYEVPATLGALQPFYNKKVLEQLNLDIPKTKEDFLNALEKSKQAGITPISLGARNGYAIGWLFGNVLEATAGHEKVQQLFFGDAHWDDPAIIQAAETFKEWVDKGYIDKESASIDDKDARARFLGDKHLIYFASTWLILDIVGENAVDKFDLAPIPSFTAGQTAYPTGGLGQSWYVPAQTDDPELSAKWMDFILTKEYADINSQDMSGSDLLASKAAAETTPVNPLLDKGIKSIVDGSGFNPSVFMGAETTEAYYQNLTGVIGGMVSPKEAMSNIEASAAKDRAAK